jgi:hypothetical protein
MYTLELLQAINDWQNSGSGKNKTQIAQRIIKHSKGLPEKFKKVNSNCYRQIALSGANSLHLGKNMELPETYSSWTLDPVIAQNFNGGVPHSTRQGVIFEIDETVEDFEVILNLYELFRDDEFIQTCTANKEKIESYKSGIGYFMGKEVEVILKIQRITVDQIWAYGGFSSSKEELAEIFFGRKPSIKELEYFDILTARSGAHLGGKWVTGEIKDRVVNFHINTAERLTTRKNKNRL